MKGYRRKVGTRFHVEPYPGEEVERALKEAGIGGIHGVHHAPVIPIAALVISAAGAAYSIYSSKQAADEQKKIAAANAARIKAENEEALRKLKKQQEATLAEARARAAASGLTTEGTQRTYLEEMADAFKSETDWLRRSGASQAEITMREGQLAADITRARGVTSGLSQLGSGLTTYYGMK